MITLKIIAIFLLYGAFGIIHSYLALIDIKSKIARKYPGYLPYYRLSYNIFSCVTFYFVYEYTPVIDIRLYDLQPPFDILILIPQVLSLIGILWVFRYIHVKEFLGIAQIQRHVAGNYQTEELDEHSELITGGVFRWSRHPLYFFSIIFLLSRPYMFLDYTISILCISLYFFIGSVYEEKRMVSHFGELYEQYRKRTSRIIPFIL